MAFSTLFQLYHGSQCTYPCFPAVSFYQCYAQYFSQKMLVYCILLRKTNLNFDFYSILWSANSGLSRIFSFCGKDLILCHTVRTFNISKEEGFGKHCVGKGENAGYQHFLLFPQCFLLYHREKSSF